VPPQPKWAELSVDNRRILSPLGNEWDAMENYRRKKWLDITERWPKMSREERNRAWDRMREWAKLTPAERNAARQRYAEMQKLPPEQREALRRQYEAYAALPEDERQKLQAIGDAAQNLDPAATEAGRRGQAVGRQATDSTAACGGAGRHGTAPSAAPVTPAAVPPARRQQPRSGAAKTVSAATAALRSRLASLPLRDPAGLCRAAVSFALPHILLGMFAQRMTTTGVLWAHIFLVLFMYFGWFWLHGGQTLAIEDLAGAPGGGGRQRAATVAGDPALFAGLAEPRAVRCRPALVLGRRRSPVPPRPPGGTRLIEAPG